MVQQHPYCRTCGSLVRSKEVCHYCGCAPLAGHNYCCDCGTSTIPEAIMCIHCGASFQKKFPATLAVLISIVVVATFAVTGYFISQSNDEPPERIADNIITDNRKDSSNLEVPGIKNESGKIIVNDPTNLLKKRDDVIQQLVKNLPRLPKPQPEVTPKTVVPEKPREEIIPVEKPQPIQTRANLNVFSSREMRSYAAGCTYFTGKSKNNVVFFTTNVYGYVKVNGKVFALQGIQKGNDIAMFSGAGFEVSIEILGLAGNENEWLAEATMIIRDVRQRTLSTHKIYSTCTDF